MTPEISETLISHCVNQVRANNLGREEAVLRIAELFLAPNHPLLKLIAGYIDMPKVEKNQYELLEDFLETLKQGFTNDGIISALEMSLMTWRESNDVE